ncbi:hypothetical protein FA13DRAFT_2232 [Coprinellus micaceus]|uniref:Protein kinase domain-containing protein n=1 Tax=Coprinellus micaceus TaxID=71717 RepID=A0A4Y7TZ40_COPMI|nr:hypothetical protein FA13DRAFT_2232 [Coprinellus micaceus]
MSWLPCGNAKSPKNVSELLHDKDWVRAFVNGLWGWVLATLCTRRSNLKAFWAEKSPDQIDNICLYLKNVSDVSIPASPWSVLTRLTTGLWSWLVQGILAALGLLQAALILSHPLGERLTQAWVQHQLRRRLKKYRWISMGEGPGYVLELHNRDNANTERCWTLPPSDNQSFSETAGTYIYANPPIVVKIFFKSGSSYYKRERKAYKRLASLSCSKPFPVLYASGRVLEHGRPFLVLSNEGEQVDAVTESDKRALEPIIEQMHSAGVWHNDLHARNVLRNRKGELRIVDFGAASFHDRGKDRWKEDFMG